MIFPQKIEKLSHTILFAEETSILVTYTNYIELNQKLHSILCHISKWFQTNQLVLNTDKTYVVKCTSSETLIRPLTFWQRIFFFKF